MMRINLLPHREIKRKQRQKDFFIMLASVAGLGAAIWFGVHTILNGELENQQSRNAYDALFVKLQQATLKGERIEIAVRLTPHEE